MSLLVRVRADNRVRERMFAREMASPPVVHEDRHEETAVSCEHIGIVRRHPTIHNGRPWPPSRWACSVDASSQTRRAAVRL
jgi:hypothetical protein